MNPIAFTSPLGGVLTDDAGAISGDLELVAVADGHATVRYVGAADTYTVTGTAPDGWANNDVVTHLTRDPGTDTDGNPAPTSLTDAR